MRFLRYGAVPAALAVAAALLVTSTAAAGRQRSTQCVGPLGPVTVYGDLVVPNGASCQLAGTRVTGSVQVLAAANLQTSAGTTIGGSLSCGGAECDVSETTIGGEAELEPGAGAMYVVASRMASVDCDGAQCNLGPNFSTSEPTVVSHDVRVASPAYASLQGVTTGGSVTCKACLGLDVVDSTIGGHIISDDQVLGATIYTNTVAGNVMFTDNHAFLTTYGNTIGGNFQVFRNGGTIGLFSNTVSNNILLMFNKASEIDVFENRVRLNIICQWNVPQPVGAANTAKRIDRDCGPIGLPYPPPAP